MSEAEIKTKTDKKNSNEKIKIILICNHMMIREGLENICRKAPGFSLDKSYHSFKTIKNSDFNNDVSLILLCPSCNKSHLKHPSQMIQKLKNFFPNGNIVIIEDIFDDAEKTEFIKLGVKGFLSKNISRENMRRAFITILQGEFWISRNLSRDLIDQLINMTTKTREYITPENIFKLSAREIEILQAIASGLTNIEISNKLFISEKTVKAHIYNIFKKMEVKTRIKAVIKAIDLQII